MVRLLLTLWVLSGVAWAAEPPTVLVQPPRPGTPLWVGELPAGEAFRLAVRQVDGFTAQRVKVWRRTGDGCAAEPTKGVRRFGAGPTVTVEDQPATPFALPRLAINTEWCLRVEGMWSVGAAEREAVNAALDTLLKHPDTADRPATRARRIGALKAQLGPLGEQRVRCARPPLCRKGKDLPLVDALNAWIEGDRAGSPFARARQPLLDVASARTNRAGALKTLAALTDLDGHAAVAAHLASAKTLAVDLELLSGATPAVDGDGVLVEGAKSLRHELTVLMEAANQAAEAPACAAESPECDRLISAAEEAEAALEALKKEQAAGAAFEAARTEVLAAFDTWAAGFPLSNPVSVETEVPAYTERAAWYIGVDVGVAMPFFGTEASLAAYVGASFSFVPVDKDTPLTDDDGFWKRFSLLAGFTLNEPTDTAGTVSPALGGTSLLAGAGFRLTDYLRASAGGLIYRQSDPDPTITADRLRVAPFVGLSIDIDVAGMLKSSYSGAQGL